MRDKENDPQLSRADRRFAVRMGRAIARNPRVTRITSLTSMEQVLSQEDDFKFFQEEFKSRNSALSYETVVLQYFLALKSLGHSETFLRDIYRYTYQEGFDKEPEEMSDVSPEKHTLVARTLASLESIVLKKKKVFTDEDTAFIFDMIKEEVDIPIIDLIKEKRRSDLENCDLLRMQVNFLEDQKRQQAKEEKAKKREVQKNKQSKPQAQAEKVEVIVEPENIGESSVFKAEPFLRGWDVFWDRRDFSQDRHHWVPLPTSSKGEATEALRKLGQGQISIPPGNILSAVEFYLRKDVIERALSARLKYVPDEVKDWIKITRRRDRVYLLIPKDQPHQAVFFADGRDVVYRSL